MTDGQLLEHFIAEGDEFAFAALVERHGPQVMGVCQRVLGEPNDAEDAFQATFLVLARKAASVGNPNLLGNWLYGVAHRTALEARSKILRRHAKEKRILQEPSVEPTPEVIWRELREVLDEEVSRLPDKYRIPFVLCYLQGQTNEEAALRLRCPKGTILSRLATARERLRARLIRRGLAVSVASLGYLLAEKAIAAVPSSLTVSTIQAGANLAAGQPLATVASGQVAALTQGVLRAMFLSKMKVATAAILGLLLFGLGAAMLAQAFAHDEAKGDKEKLAGEWMALKVIDDGNAFENAGVEKSKILFDGDKMISHMSQDGIRIDRDEFTFEIDPTKKPKAITLTKANGNTWLGIYRLEGDKLTICTAHRTAEKRPGEFAAKNGSRAMLVVLQRAK